ncbi:intraflagellar transport protein 57 homolog isoform X4 [Varanus komodoensis]|uniref:intraflagellar transport protein 57 homolog isoform X4 n=1 Tax=Varanus komodoensis TaxID=61221 RepID=UPI001CF7AD9F|nr:intraflagellar transport protein 57 homolog isoform X4 [Varanus komodoensis]
MVMAAAEEGDAAAERGPGAAYHMFVMMEDLLEKLKLLNYEEEAALRSHNMRPPSRHYFALPINPGEQFYMFCTLAAWLINKAGHPFEQPQEYDDPNATISSILSELRSFGRSVDFPPSKLKAGYGEQACYVLDCLAEEALKYTSFAWKRPMYPTEEVEEEAITEDDAELTLNKVEEIFAEEETDNEENYIDLNVLKAQTYKSDMIESKQEEILESTVDAAEWNLEVERVLPQLKVTIRTDNKDWRIHVDQMHQHQDGIESALKDTRGYLDKLHNEISKTLEKVSSREKYINNQLEHLVQEYRSAQALLSEAKEKYKQGSGGVTERTRILSEITEELEKVKQEMEEKGSSMTDGVDSSANCFLSSLLLFLKLLGALHEQSYRRDHFQDGSHSAGGHHRDSLLLQRSMIPASGTSDLFSTSPPCLLGCIDQTHFITWEQAPSQDEKHFHMWDLNGF